MKVVILCGGRGTRLREETEFKPKPLVDVGGKPILWHIMKIYAHYGLRDFILCLGYKGGMIKEYFLNYEAMNNDFTINLGSHSELAFHGGHEEQDFRVTLAETGSETMTGGRVKRASRYIDSDTFCVTYGDGVADVNIADLLAFHKSHGKLATMTTVRPYSRYGILDLAPDGAVHSFIEKPQLDGSANAGFFVFNKEVLNYLDEHCVMEKEPLETLAREGQLMAYRHESFFFSMDTFREYKLLNELWDSGKAPWKVWGKK